ncbi:M14 family metallopeptidase [Neobacillus mesonae]|uniref:M14 family metallopeptidase n=1 Tax=Neobacillus mesonae TaxID=1193713 RepID=UPI00204145EA|nr:M14 family metallopeptidase [Neobacillus mesonae]MCM3570681.1 M14 family metallopeptidase [Neobacillus mesonae]
MDIVVRRGDTLTYYSGLFQIHQQLIVDSNPGIQPEKLPIGEIIKIPGYESRGYFIKHGDSFWAIAQKVKVPLDALQLLNHDVNPNKPQAGQMIKVPQRITQRVVQGKQNYDYDVLKRDLRRLQYIYPFLGSASIGKTVLENNIPEIKVGHGPKKIHFNGSFHANEWITTAVIMTFLNDYLLSLTNQTLLRGTETLPLYQETCLSIVPMVNPDGVNLVLKGPPDDWKKELVELNNGVLDFSGWKANIRGVDLNDQFPAKWEEERMEHPKQPGPRDFGGEQPLTEPEAIAMAELTKVRDFSRVLAFHTQGEEMYWGFDQREPPESEAIVNEFSRVSGYEPVRNIKSYAGYKDWFIQEWRRPGFTIELGNGVNPLPIEQFDKIYHDTVGIFLAGLYM